MLDLCIIEKHPCKIPESASVVFIYRDIKETKKHCLYEIQWDYKNNNYLNYGKRSMFIFSEFVTANQHNIPIRQSVVHVYPPKNYLVKIPHITLKREENDANYYDLYSLIIETLTEPEQVVGYIGDRVPILAKAVFDEGRIYGRIE